MPEILARAMKKFLIKRKLDRSFQKHGFTRKKLWGKMNSTLNYIHRLGLFLQNSQFCRFLMANRTVPRYGGGLKLYCFSELLWDAKGANTN